MKTQIIALDEQEDYLSVRDKLNWSQTGRVLLNWPNEQRILARLDLVLIQRHSTARGVQLALVTKNADIRAEALQLGIPTFDSSVEAQTARWRTARRGISARSMLSRRRRRTSQPDLTELRKTARPRQADWLSHPIVTISAFALSMLAIMALLVFTVPRASLTLQPESQPQTLTIEVTASPEISQVNLAGRLPTYPVSVIVEARGSLPASGTVTAPFKPAIGGIQFTNLTEGAVQVPEGTVVSTLDNPAVRFATNKSGLVPAGVGQSIILSATALMPGAVGNLPANSLVAVEGQLGLSLSATNLAATHSGSDGPVSGPSEADRQALLEQVTADLEKTAAEEMQALVAAGDLALTSSLSYLQTLAETYRPEIGQPGEQLELTLRLEFIGQAVSNANLRALVTPPMDAALPEGYIPLPETLSVTLSTTPLVNAGGEITFAVTAQRNIQADIPAGRVIALIRGVMVEQARPSLMEALPLAGRPQIEISPSWWPRLPYNPLRIRVQTTSVQ